MQADHPVTVSRIVDECPGVRTLRLELPEGLPFSFCPGQFVMVAFPDHPEVKRAYSIASSPLETGHVEITLNRVGKMTRHLFDLRGGETLLLSGPHGVWHYREEDKHAVFISEGTGIAPLRSMIRYVLDKGLPARLVLIHSAPDPGSLIYRQELKDFERRGVQVHVVGRFDEARLRGLVPAGPGATYYLCGANHLVESLKRILAKAGIPPSRVLYEKWGEF